MGLFIKFLVTVYQPKNYCESVFGFFNDKHDNAYYYGAQCKQGNTHHENQNSTYVSV